MVEKKNRDAKKKRDKVKIYGYGEGLGKMDICATLCIKKKNWSVKKKKTEDMGKKI